VGTEGHARRKSSPELNEAAIKALDDPTIKARLADLSNEIFPRDQLTPEALAKFHQPRSRSGGRSSRRPTSRRNDAGADAAHDHRRNGARAADRSPHRRHSGCACRSRRR
jgi:hypothetical protein